MTLKGNDEPEEALPEPEEALPEQVAAAPANAKQEGNWGYLVRGGGRRRHRKTRKSHRKHKNRTRRHK
jgi:hypothetical protein